MRWTPAVLFAGLVVAGAARADDAGPRKYDLNAADRWDAGEAVTVTWRNVTKNVSSLQGPSGPPQEQRRNLTDEATYVRRCESVDAAGQPSKSVVHVSAWCHAIDDDEDKSLAGALVEVADGAWTLLTPGVTPSPAAREWLDSQFGRGAYDLVANSGIRPADPVAVGDTWAPRGGFDADSLIRRTSLPAHAKDAKSSVTLTAADGDVVHVALTSDAGLEADAAKTSGRSVTLIEPSSFSQRITADGVPARWHSTGEFKSTCVVELSTKYAGKDMTLRVSHEETRTAAAGGEVPSLPARDPSAAPLVRIARAAAWKAGDSVTDSGRSILSVADTPVGADGKAGETSATIVTTTWSAVRRCTQASDSGVPEKFTVWIERWSSESGGVSDGCLQGALVEVGAKGWKIQNPEIKPTKAASQWLAAEFGSAAAAAADDAFRALVTPLAPVAVGDQWHADARETAALLRGLLGMPVDPEQVSLTAKLDSADASRAVVSYTIDGAISCVAGCNCSNSELLQGGTIKVSGKATGGVGDWARSGDVSGDMKANVSVPAKGDGLRRIGIILTRQRTRAAGGDIPQQ